MKRTPLRLALASAVTAAIAFGTVSAAEAKPKQPTFVKYDKKRTVKKATKALVAAQVQVARDASTKVAALSKVDTSVRLGRLGAVLTPQVRANIATDKANLVALVAKSSAATTVADVASVRVAVASYRPEVYHQVLAILADDVRLDAKVTGLNKAIATTAATADAKALAGGDVTAVRASLDAAAAAVTAVDVAVDKSVASALAVHANTPKKGVDSALVLAKDAKKSAAIKFAGAQKHLAIAQIALASVTVPPTA